MNRNPSGKVPLERALSKLGLASRSQARRWIRNGRISIYGKPIHNPLAPVTPETTKVMLDGKPLVPPHHRTFIFYKPRGVVTTRSDEKGRKTVLDFFKDSDIALHAVGRLDLASSGLLILTNDTKLSSKLTDPSNSVIRTYVVTVRGAMTPAEITDLPAARAVLRKTSCKESHLVVDLQEGKNRQIRKMFEAIGHEVTSLKRVSYGVFTLGNLQPGEYREVTDQELRQAFS